MICFFSSRRNADLEGDIEYSGYAGRGDHAASAGCVEMISDGMGFDAEESSQAHSGHR